jgi:hypothetical protein
VKGRVAQAFDLDSVSSTVGAPSLRSLQGRESEMLARRGPITPSGARNEIFVHSSSPADDERRNCDAGCWA